MWFLGIDLTQVVADIDFNIFCILYTSQGIINTSLMQSTMSRAS